MQKFFLTRNTYIQLHVNMTCIQIEELLDLDFTTFVLRANNSASLWLINSEIYHTL